VSNPGANPNVPQIPAPRPNSLIVTVEALKQAVDSLSGFRGSQLGRAVTFNDLVRLGLTTENAVTSERGAVQPVTSSLITPSDPASTASASGEMMGLGASVLISPGPTGALVVVFAGDCSIDTDTAEATIQAYLGSGTAPANGDTPPANAALIGREWQGIMAAADQKIGFAIPVAVSGLSPIQQLWLDLSLATSAGNALIENLNVTILQL
jgi:hypothetical protein